MKRESIIESIKLLKDMEPILKKLLELKDIEWDDDDNFTSEEYYQMYVLHNISNSVEQVFNYLTQNLNAPIIAEGYAKKDSKGEYQLEGYWLLPGQQIEFWYEDDYDPETSHYLISEIGVDKGKYYIESLGKEVNIEGVKIRLKTY